MSWALVCCSALSRVVAIVVVCCLAWLWLCVFWPLSFLSFPPLPNVVCVICHVLCFGSRLYLGVCGVVGGQSAYTAQRPTLPNTFAGRCRGCDAWPGAIVPLFVGASCQCCASTSMPDRSGLVVGATKCSHFSVSCGCPCVVSGGRRRIDSILFGPFLWPRLCDVILAGYVSRSGCACDAVLAVSLNRWRSRRLCGPTDTCRIAFLGQALVAALVWVSPVPLLDRCSSARSGAACPHTILMRACKVCVWCLLAEPNLS